MKVLWAMPIVQLCLLVFFTLDAWLHFWMNWALLILCLVTGIVFQKLLRSIFSWLHADF